MLSMRTMKILVGVAAGLLLLVTGIAVYEQWQLRTTTATAEPTVKGTPSQEVFAKYFTSVNLTDSTVASQYSLRLKWEKIKPTPEGQVVVRTIDTAKDIFISESAGLNIREYSGINIKNPGTPGNYELWLYVITDDQESLAATIPFTITE